MTTTKHTHKAWTDEGGTSDEVVVERVSQTQPEAQPLRQEQEEAVVSDEQ